MKTLVLLLGVVLPWALKRRLYSAWLGYRIDPSAYIGLSFVSPRRLEMAAGARIGHLNVAKGLDLIAMEAHASIGNMNWITGFPPGPSVHFAHVTDRAPELSVGSQAAVTHRHIIDCTHRVRIGAFSTFAGFRSQILTHSIDLSANRQHCAPVTIGERCFVGTACVLLPGSSLPDRSVLAAGAVLARPATEPGVHGGVPAKWIQPAQGAYFDRERGFVD
jgi:serine acetyltransferase